MTILKSGGAAIATILVLDLVWLGFVMTSFYVRQMDGVGNIVDGKIQPVLWSAVVVYALLTAGILFFVVPSVENAGLGQAFLKGLVWGVIVYGIYDFTNLATLKSWPLILALADTAWGGFVCACAATAAVAVSRTA